MAGVVQISISIGEVVTRAMALPATPVLDASNLFLIDGSLGRYDRLGLLLMSVVLAVDRDERPGELPRERQCSYDIHDSPLPDHLTSGDARTCDRERARRGLPGDTRISSWSGAGGRRRQLGVRDRGAIARCHTWTTDDPDTSVIQSPVPSAAANPTSPKGRVPMI